MIWVIQLPWRCWQGNLLTLLPDLHVLVTFFYENRVIKKYNHRSVESSQLPVDSSRQDCTVNSVVSFNLEVV